MEIVLQTITTIVATSRLALHQSVGLPLVTNGPDNANANDNSNHQRGRSWGQRPV